MSEVSPAMLQRLAADLRARLGEHAASNGITLAEAADEWRRHLGLPVTSNTPGPIPRGDQTGGASAPGEGARS